MRHWIRKKFQRPLPDGFLSIFALREKESCSRGRRLRDFGSAFGSAEGPWLRSSQATQARPSSSLRCQSLLKIRRLCGLPLPLGLKTLGLSALASSASPAQVRTQSGPFNSKNYDSKGRVHFPSNRLTYPFFIFFPSNVTVHATSMQLLSQHYKILNIFQTTLTSGHYLRYFRNTGLRIRL